VDVLAEVFAGGRDAFEVAVDAAPALDLRRREPAWTNPPRTK